MIGVRKALRILGWIVAVPAALLVCLAIAIPVQQHLFRWRAERLLADMQEIELHKTTWAQAQELMRRWGAWGHYDGSCTWINCRYVIALSDLSSIDRRPEEHSFVHYTSLPFFLSPAYGWVGGRVGSFDASFIVQDGTVRRTLFHSSVYVPPHTADKNDDYGYDLIVFVQSRPSLNRDTVEPDSHWILGGDEQLAKHPFYKAGRPSGCEGCMSIEVTYSSQTPHDQIRQLSDFDFSCLTRWKPCLIPEEVLPAARSWHIYLPDDPSQAGLPKAPWPCDIPVWALGRDAISVFSVEALSVSLKRRDYDVSGPPFEDAKARVMETLKGVAPWPIQSVIDAFPYSGDFNVSGVEPAEHMMPGNRYLALVKYRFHEDRYSNMPQPPPGTVDGVPGILLDRCGVLDDTPQNRAELTRGLAQNDPLRVPEF